MTTITTAKLREIAHTLGVSPEHLKCVIGVTWGVTIDDTPADETEHDMDKMTTTQEQLAAQAKHYGLPELAAANFVASLGITIARAEPPEAMVRLAERFADEGWRAAQGDPSRAAKIAALAALQHADKAMDEAVAELAGTAAGLKPHNLYGAFKRKIGAA